jgi:hypothetical protein
MCFTVSSAGGRRGAQMGTFDISHPDVVDFIRAKRENGRLRQFNLSLLVTEEFMQAVANDYDSGCVPVERLGLEVIARSASTTDGLYLTDLEASTTVTVRTTFSVYRITRLLGTTILVQGGKSFPETTPAILRGATFGGSVLKVGWIGVGLCMEIRAGDRRVVTSPVREITIGQVGQVGQVG